MFFDMGNQRGPLCKSSFTIIIGTSQFLVFMDNFNMFTKVFWSQVTFGTILACVPKTNNREIMINLVVNQVILVFLNDFNMFPKIFWSQVTLGTILVGACT